MSVLAQGWWLVALLLAELAFGLAWNRGGLNCLRRPRFWSFFLFTLAISPFLVGRPDVVFGPFHLSREGLATGLQMTGRALALTMAFNVGLAGLSLSDLVAVLGRLGLGGLGFALGLAVNLLTTLQDLVLVTLQTIRMRGGTRRPGLALRCFLVTSIANTLRQGDDLVNAAVVRAFDPTRSRPVSLPPGRPDGALAVALGACTVALLLVAR